MSVYVAIKLAKSCIHAAEFNLAKKTLSKVPYVHETLDSDQKETILNAQLLVCTIGLLQGKWEEALKAANEAECQAQRIHEVVPDVTDSTVLSLSSVSGLKGMLTITNVNCKPYESSIMSRQ